MLAKVRCRPIVRTLEWRPACAPGTSPRSSNASSARYDAARRSAHAFAPRERATSVPLRGVPASTIPTWNCRSELRVGDARSSRQKDAHATLNYSLGPFVPGTHTASHRPFFAFHVAPGRQCPIVARRREHQKDDSRSKKMTRPDGEIRAGRFDRRRGSGGRERRSGL